MQENLLTFSSYKALDHYGTKPTITSAVMQKHLFSHIVVSNIS